MCFMRYNIYLYFFYSTIFFFQPWTHRLQVVASVNEHTPVVRFLVMRILTSVFWCYIVVETMPLIAVILPSLWVSSGQITVQPTEYCCICFGTMHWLSFLGTIHRQQSQFSCISHIKYEYFLWILARLVGHVHKILCWALRSFVKL